MRYSVVVPLHNEEGNVSELYRRISDVFDGVDESVEMVFVDDGSTDSTFELLAAIHQDDPRVNVVRLRRNFGQTAALRAGFDFARGDVVVAMDGDLQDDPAEIPALLAKLDEGYDIVSAWRRTREEAWLTRRVPSRMANWLLARISGVDIHDFGTTFKAYRREVLARIDLHTNMHRYIPALATRFGARIAEVPVRQHARGSGRSHYGLGRIPEVAIDLVYLKFMLDGAARPLREFGGLGLAFALGAALVLLFGRSQPHLILSVAALLICGVELAGIGLVGELLARRARSAPRPRIYAVRAVVSDRERDSRDHEEATQRSR